MGNEIKVSIICNAYNHEKYIEKAIDSFIMQKTDFTYEILIHDDASTDKTAKIIKQYEERYPDIVKPIYQTENQYSKGKDINAVYQYPRVNGQYIAFCEGDDFWTDERKLQKQVEALEENIAINICAHSALAVRANTEKVLYKISPSKETCIFNVKKVIQGGGGFVSTNTLMVRRCILESIPEYYTYFPIDYALQIQGSIDNGMLYLGDTMAAYRIMADNSWSVVMRNDPMKRYQINLKIIEMLKILNHSTQGKYEEVILEKSEELEYWGLYYLGQYKEMKENKKMYGKLSSKEKLIINFKMYAPASIIELRRKIFG